MARAVSPSPFLVILGLRPGAKETEHRHEAVLGPLIYISQPAKSPNWSCLRLGYAGTRP